MYTQSGAFSRQAFSAEGFASGLNRIGKTPNIDRIAKEGIMFTDSYGEQSCTAGRSSFITGQDGSWLR